MRYGMTCWARSIRIHFSNLGPTVNNIREYDETILHNWFFSLFILSKIWYLSIPDTVTVYKKIHSICANIGIDFWQKCRKNHFQKNFASKKVNTPFSLVCGINDGNRQLVPKYRIRGNNAFMSTPLSCRHLIYNLVVSVPSIVCYRSMASLFRNFFSWFSLLATIFSCNTVQRCI